MKVENVLEQLTAPLCKLIKETFEGESEYLTKYVLPSLSLKQQRTKPNSIEDLDLASLIRVITYNIQENNELVIEDLPIGYKNFCFEMTAIRNKYAHKNSIQIKIDDEIRDIDTILRFIEPLKIDNSLKKIVKDLKENLEITKTKSKIFQIGNVENIYYQNNKNFIEKVKTKKGETMIEKDMEDLIAKFPNDFFPRKKLILKERQGTFAGVGRFDLLFEDEFGSNILMELKARPAKYKDATQIAKYKEALEKTDSNNIIMWLVAPQIPSSVREFLDRIGIEYSEIHEAEYRNVAKKRGVEITSEIHKPTEYDDTARMPQNDYYKGDKSYNYSSIRFSNKIQRKFRMNREKLRNRFPAAYDFLCFPERFSNSGLWLSTATNAHLYYKNGFLMYIVIRNNSIILSPNFNGRIHSETSNKSNRIFPKIINEIIKPLNGFDNGWVTRNIDDIILKSSTPADFFNLLLKTIQELNL